MHPRSFRSPCVRTRILINRYLRSHPSQPSRCRTPSTRSFATKKETTTLKQHFKRRSDSELLNIDLLRKLPKAELHLHLDGSVRPSTIIDLAQEQGVALPTFDVAEMERIVRVGDKAKSLEDYLKIFDLIISVLQKPYAITRTMYEVCEDAVKDGIKYLEVRFSPILHIQHGMSLSQVMEAICEGQQMAEMNLPITVRIIVCGMRQLPTSVTEKLAEIAWRYQDNGVCAFDLAGPEFGFSSKIHRSAFEIIRKKNLNCTLHSGEAAPWQSILDSIQYCGAHRIGHGVQLISNPELLHFVVDRRIAIESCVTSNLQTKAVSSIDKHPFRKFFDEGVIVVPCTDNTQISDVSLSGEYALIQKHFNFKVSEIVKLIENSFSSMFLHSSLKYRLRAEALQHCVNMLHKEGFDLTAIDTPHYRQMGIEIPHTPATPEATTINLGKDFATVSSHAYWGGHSNPQISSDLLRKLPKADLHCRLDGSVPSKTMWEEITRCPTDIMTSVGLKRATSFEEFEKDLVSMLGDEEEEGKYRNMMNQLLQTPAQIQKGFEEMIKNAIHDGVMYIEVAVRPASHLNGTFKHAEDVMDLITDLKKSMESKYPIKIGINIHSSSIKDDPIQYRHNAELSLKYRDKGVCGYAMLQKDIPANAYEYFRSTFDFLKHHNMKVVMTAGSVDVNTITNAIHIAGAHRISGAFSLHQSPELLNYIADHQIPIELGLTPKFEHHVAGIRTFAGNPIRLLFDNHCVVTICSFHNTLTHSQSRIDGLYNVVKECNFSISEVLKVLQYGFVHNFQSHPERTKMAADAWNQSTKILSQKGFQYFHKKFYMPY